MKTVYGNLDVSTIDRAYHLKTCGYWYIVTTGAMSHTAFRTAEGLKRWLAERNLKLERPLVEADGTKHDYQRIRGSYAKHMHMMEVEEWAKFRPVITSRTLSNGDYVEAKITEDGQGVRTVHTLNPNVRNRITFDYSESNKMMG